MNKQKDRIVHGLMSDTSSSVTDRDSTPGNSASERDMSSDLSVATPEDSLGAKASTQSQKASTCQHCGKRIPDHMRSHSKHCSRSCRTLAWRIRKKAKDKTILVGDATTNGSRENEHR